jgi:hypothetical protein
MIWSIVRPFLIASVIGLIAIMAVTSRSVVNIAGGGGAILPASASDASGTGHL